MSLATGIRAVALLVLLLSMPALCRAQGVRSGSPFDAADSGVVDQPIRPGDVVRLRIWREPDLSGEFPVDARGVAVFPKIGDLDVGSQTADSLRAHVTARYAVFLRNPSIEVVVLRRITVGGAVVHAGVFTVDPTMTIGDVLALSGGPTPLGSPSRAELLRNGKRLPVSINLEDRVTDLPIRSGDQIFVPERAWISQNAGVLASIIGATASILVAWVIRR